MGTTGIKLLFSWIGSQFLSFQGHYSQSTNWINEKRWPNLSIKALRRRGSPTPHESSLKRICLSPWRIRRSHISSTDKSKTQYFDEKIWSPFGLKGEQLIVQFRWRSSESFSYNGSNSNGKRSVENFNVWLYQIRRLFHHEKCQSILNMDSIWRDQVWREFSFETFSSNSIPSGKRRHLRLHFPDSWIRTCSRRCIRRVWNGSRRISSVPGINSFLIDQRSKSLCRTR